MTSNTVSPGDGAGQVYVDVVGVTKSFGANQVLKGVDLQVQAGECVVLLGASGSGKTTLLRSVAALETPDAGSIRVVSHQLDFGSAGKRTHGEKELRAFRSDTGMVFQQYNLFPHLTVLENMTVAPRHVHGTGKAEAEAAAVKLLARVGLADKAGSYPLQLSGGQQQRVAIARALALNPRVMLFDEVTSALDPQLVEEVENVIQQLACDGMTMLLVTHELSFARAVADRIVFMSNGIVLETGTPAQILDNPAHEETRRFVKRAQRV
ncbi:peptide ABC transporter ATP-binding protein [Micromonospora qiuiae]|uniref:Peptide ABC transporter ATP-binding protein n=1 Tax=Micromonospora qiuiae TaxID=502268 RepID=A0ABQ4JLT3_9ACTN|nr:peptide ABC transporter ATP-binding protein [Micromonospora qiuiae]